MATSIPQVVNSKPNGQANGQAAKPSYADLLARVQQLEQEQANRSTITIRINDGEKEVDGQMVKGKGTVCVYGLGRYPVALYAEQWERLLTQDHVGTILNLCKDPRASRKAAK